MIYATLAITDFAGIATHMPLILSLIYDVNVDITPLPLRHSLITTPVGHYFFHISHWLASHWLLLLAVATALVINIIINVDVSW